MEKVTRVAAKFVKGGIVVVAGLAAAVALFGLCARPSPADCIIVLGCRVYGTVPSPFLVARLDEGVRLYKEGYGRRMVVSGGQGAGEDITEALAMKRYLLTQGVAQDHIIMEGESTSTEENLRFSFAKMRQNNLQTAVLVSNKYHLLRATLIGKRLGMPHTCSGVFVSAHVMTEAKGFLRELAGIPYSLIKSLQPFPT